MEKLNDRGKEMNKVDRLNTIIMKNTNCIDYDLEEQTDLIDNLLYNSISLFMLIVQIEEEFNFKFPVETLILDNIRDYTYLVNAVTKYTEN